MNYIVVIEEVNRAQVSVEAENLAEAEAKALHVCDEGNCQWVYGKPFVIEIREDE